MKIFFLVLSLSCLVKVTSAQVNVRDSAAQGVLFGIGSSLQWPGADMADKFGFSVDMSLDTWYKTKSHWLFGVGASFFFGDDVRIGDQLVEGITTSQGQLISLNGNYGDYKFFERGFTTQASVGRVFTSLGHNANSGLVTIIGLGYLQHRIRIENAGQDIPQLLGDYEKGYDRMSGGPMTRQFIGYLHAGSRRRVNFLIGLDLMQGFTTDYRGFHFDTAKEANQSQLDLFYGFRFIWFLPVYSGATETYFYR
jgi:hypothetical protein